MWHTNAAVVPTRAWPDVAHGREGWPGRADARHPATGPPRRFLPRMAGCDVSRGVWVAHVAGLPLWAALVRWSVGVLRRGGEEGVKRRKRERRMLVWVWVWRREEEGAPNRPVWQSVWPHRCCRWRSGGRGRRVWPWAQQWAWRLAYSCAWRSA